MNFPKFPSKQKTSINLGEALTNLQTQFSSFLQNLSHLQHQTHQAIGETISHFAANSPLRHSTETPPPWARMGPAGLHRGGSAAQGPLNAQVLEERLAGVPVFALSNSDGEFVMVTAASSGQSLGLLCFKEGDAEALLEQLRSVPVGATGTPESKVVPLALNKVLQLKIDGVAFRLIPDSSQVKHALELREKAGVSDCGFTGVPVFQSRSLVLRSQDKSYRPMFFRKEDLDRSVREALEQLGKLNPATREGDTQVAVFEEVIKAMKEGSNSIWNDVVFIPPGFNVYTSDSNPGQVAENSVESSLSFSTVGADVAEEYFD